LYAREVLQLLGAHPGREFRMAQIRRYVETQLNVPETDVARREAIRQGLVRVLEELIATGAVIAVRPPKNRRSRRYIWRLSAPDVT